MSKRVRSSLILPAVCGLGLAAVLLSSCSSKAPQQPARQAGISGPGDYSRPHRDGAPWWDVDVSRIPDAVPMPHNGSVKANPYTVLGKTYYPMNDARAYRMVGTASWYGTKFHGQATANGETYDLYGMTAAHKTLPLPSYVRVTNLDNGKSVIVRVNDRGPFYSEHILHQVLPGENTMAFWYHFAILFEALFILTAVDAGTRAGRFMLQDLLGNFVPALKKTESWTANIIGTGGCVALWGWLLYQGVVDPLGGINTLWPLFGISNQMLAGIALMLATVVLIKMKRQQYVWVTILPAAWLLICTTTAGLIKIFDSNPAVGFVALGEKYATALDAGQVLAPAKDIGQMQHVVLNAYINAGLTVLFLLVVFSVLFYAIKVGIAAWGKSERTDKETPFEPIPDA